MIRVGVLNMDTFEGDLPPLESESYLEIHDYPVTVERAWTATNVKQEEENTGHIVKEVTTLGVPQERADAVTDETTILMCSCKGYRYHSGIQDLSEHDELRWESCKHCDAVDPSVKASHDEQQREL